MLCKTEHPKSNPYISKLERDQGDSPCGCLGEDDVRQRENSLCKGPGVRASLAYLREKREANKVGAV